MATPYPDQFPLAEATNVVEIVRNKQVQERVTELAHDLWVIQGFAQGKLVGTAGAFATKESVPEQDGIAALQKAIDAETQPSAQADIPWDVIIRYAIQLLIIILS
jgi:hypothetical protein